MVKYLIVLIVVCATTMVVTTGCDDHHDLAESSFGKIGEKNSKASPASVISMGRDDEEGKAKKWHIGGSD